MAAPAFRAVAHGNAASGTSLTVNKPTGTVNNDVMVAFIYCSPPAAEPAITPPTGWTLLGTCGDTDGVLHVYYRVAASEGASYVWSWASSTGPFCGWISSYSGADTGNPVDVQSVAAAAAGASHTTSTIITSAADRCVVSFFVKDGTGGIADSWTNGASTERDDFQETNGYIYGAVYDETKATAGSINRTGTTTAGNGTNNGRGASTAIVALNPAAVGGAPVNTGAQPQLTGTPQEGAVLKAAQNGGWTNTATSYTYQWQKASAAGGSYSNISGATSSTYTLGSSDVGWFVRCLVTATNATGSGSSPSNETYEAVRVSSTPKATAAQLGFSIGGNFFNRTQAQQQAEIDNARSVGAYYFRLEIRWSDVETSLGTFTWTLWDRIVTDITSRGGSVLMVFNYSPAWAGPGGTAPPTIDSHLADFATAVVNRYKPGGTYGLTSGTGVKVWEVWNEPNIPGFWGGATPNPTKYASMLAAAYTAIKAADPAATVLTAGFAPYGSYGSSDASGMNPKNYLEALYTAWGGVSRFDGLAVHTYPSTDVQDYRPSIYSGWSDLEDNTPSYRSILTAHGDQGKPIWITEHGMPIGQTGTKYPAGVTEQAVADLVTEGYSRWARFAWPKGAITYFSHRPEPSATGAYQYGLLTEAATPTPRRGWYAYRDMTIAAAAAPANTAAPTITGTATVGQTLSASTGTWTNSPTAYTYQWNRGGSAIAGATASTYVLTAADSGTTITVTVTASNSAGSASATSAATGTVGGATPVNTALPVVSGTTAVGAILACTTGTWTGATSFTYQWQRATTSGGTYTDIAGATASTYLLAAGDTGYYIRCAVTAS